MTHATVHQPRPAAAPADPDPTSLLALACDADEHLIRSRMGVPLDHAWRARVVVDAAGRVHLVPRVLGRSR